MSNSQRIDGDRVYCHQCNFEWDRAHGGLQCPVCEGEFVEIIESSSTPRPRPDSPFPPSPHHQPLQSPRSPPSPNFLHNHNPWAPDPEEDDITTFEFNTGGGGRSTFQFSSRTYTFGGGSGFRTSRDIVPDEIRGNFETMLGNIMGFNQRRQPAMTTGVFDFNTDRNDRGFGGASTPQPPDLFSMLFQAPGQQQQGTHAPGPFGFLEAMLNHAHGRRGDAVFSQEAFDRVMTQLMEQNTSSAPAPAAEEAISRLKKKPVDESMMGSDGTAECSICMDSVEVGDQVTVLPCNHWFHGECVVSWLREHDTCPHCRQPISTAENRNNTPISPSSGRRRTSRRSSSVASPLHSAEDRTDREQATADTPSGLREARQRYYGHPRQSDLNSERPPRERRTSERSQRSGGGSGGSGGGNSSGGNSGGSAGGVAEWIRNRLPFSG